MRFSVPNYVRKSLVSPFLQRYATGSMTYLGIGVRHKDGSVTSYKKFMNKHVISIIKTMSKGNFQSELPRLMQGMSKLKANSTYRVKIFSSPRVMKDTDTSKTTPCTLVLEEL